MQGEVYMSHEVIVNFIWGVHLLHGDFRGNIAPHIAQNAYDVFREKRNVHAI